MKRIILPFLILLTSIFLQAQSYEVVPRSNLSVFAGIRIQAIDFSDLNNQLANYNIGEMEGGVSGFMAGIQYRIPNTRLSTSVEASFVEACPDHVEGTETMAMLTGHNFKWNQKYIAFDKKGWSILPSIGIGYQKLCMDVDGEIAGANARITSFNEKVCSDNFYTDFLIGFEKEIAFSRNSIYFGANVGARKTLDNTTNTAKGEGGYVDWSATNTGGLVLETSFRVTIF